MCFCSLRIVSHSSGHLPSHRTVTRREVYTRLHMALKYLLHLVPSASATLSPILSVSFPFSTESKKVHVTYIRNLIELTEYAPELKSEIFALITERLVKIDVQVQVDLEDLEEDVEDNVIQDVSLSNRESLADFDGESDESDTDSDTSD